MNAAPLRIIMIFMAILTVGACASLPPLTPLDPTLKPAVLEGCRRPFLTEKSRLVHALSATLPDGSEGTAIGILVADPATRSFQTVLMTLEGWVLFDAVAGETLIVNRAMPPFDAHEFAEELTEDIRLTFFSPGKEPIAWGREDGGAKVCRFTRPDGRFVDVLKDDVGVMEIRLYGAGQNVRKRVKILSFDRAGVAETLEIHNNGWLPYTLRMKLIEHEVSQERMP